MLSPFLMPVGLVYESLARARNKFYSSSFLPVHRLERPVISVGNITLGGSGKTPLVIHIARILEHKGLTPALLSRGYRRRSGQNIRILSPPESAGVRAFDIGDEPALIRKHLQGIWLGISSDRFKAGCAIQRRQPDAVFILDDGFQHRRLWRDLDLVVADRMQPLLTNRVFPCGSLREPLAGLKRAHAVIINGIFPIPAENSIEEVLDNICPQARILHCRQRIDRAVPFHQWKGFSPAATSSTCPANAFLVSGIGNPERFERDFDELGIPVRGRHYYADHHRLRLEDWRACISEASKCGAEAIFITEKDAIKIEADPGFPIYVAVQSVEIMEKTIFESMIIGIAGRQK